MEARDPISDKIEENAVKQNISEEIDILKQRLAEKHAKIKELQNQIATKDFGINNFIIENAEKTKFSYEKISSDQLKFQYRTYRSIH